ATANTRWVPWFQPDEPDITEDESARTGDTVNTSQSSLNSNFDSNYIVFPNESVYGPVTVTQNSSNVVASSDLIQIMSHGLTTGQGPVMVSSSGTLPGGLSASTAYYIISANSNNIKLATSKANATAGTAVNITSVGTSNATLTITGVSQATDTLFILSHLANS